MENNVELNEFADFLKNKAFGINDKLEKAIKLCCEKVRSDIQFSMAHTAVDMGITYYGENKTKGHHPSLPHNPPAPDSGNLRESIRYEVHNEGGQVYGIVGSTQKDPDYAVYTEYGTSKMIERPWLRPAMRKNNDFIKNEISKVVNKTLGGGL